MTEENTFVSAAVDDGVAVLSLDRPPVNVLHIPMLAGLEATLGRLAGDGQVRALVLRAAGKMFSAGVDVADHTPDRVGDMLPLFHRVCRDLAAFPVPTIASVHGHALGGGCELVLCCDLAVMAETAKIGQPEIKLAAIAPVAALRLPYLTGYRAAADLMFTGRTLMAGEAQAIGLVNAVLPPQEVETWAMEKAAQLASLSRAAMLHLKRAILEGYGRWAEGLDGLEKSYLEELMQTHDAHEGLEAFLEKRPPAWEHR